MSAPQPLQKVSNCLTSVGARRRAGGLLAERLRDKGWSISNAAIYLGVSRQRLYTVFQDPTRARLWDCAVAGMPSYTPEVAQALQNQISAQRRKAPPKPAVTIEVTEFELGDEVMCTKHAGIADEDAKWYVDGLRGEGPDLQILVVMPDGQDWFPRKLFHEYFSTTGLNRNR